MLKKDFIKNGVIILSLYTDREHERALSETLYWTEKSPITKEEKYDYGEYQFRLKDYKEAVKWYKEAAEQLYVPAMYKMAYCMRFNLGTSSNYKEETALFGQVIIHDKESEDSEAKYRLGMCYTYGYGTKMNEKKGISYFDQAKEKNIDALYEIGMSYKKGKAGYEIDKKKAEEYFRKAYGGFCENAIFEIFDMYERKFSEFPYIREIKEAYSFKLGRLIRVAELRPCKEYLNRLAAFYEKGYPGDEGEKLEKFHRIAQKYYKKAREINVE